MQDSNQTDEESAVEGLVATVMKIERRYAHALRGAVSDRLEGIRDAIEAATGQVE